MGHIASSASFQRSDRPSMGGLERLIRLGIRAADPLGRRRGQRRRPRDLVRQFVAEGLILATVGTIRGSAWPL